MNPSFLIGKSTSMSKNLYPTPYPNILILFINKIYFFVITFMTTMLPHNLPSRDMSFSELKKAASKFLAYRLTSGSI